MIGAISPVATPSSSAAGLSKPGATGAATSNSSKSGIVTGVDTPQDTVSISGASPADQTQQSDPSQDKNNKKKTDATDPGQTTPDGKPLSDEQKQDVQKLREVDRSVHAHEQAHAAAGGALAGSPSYDYETGPDGHRYAVGGEVPISVPSGSGSNPDATAQKLRQVIAAALAPADPSGQDRAVAGQARAELAKVQAEAQKQSTEKLQKALGKDDTEGATGEKTTAEGSSSNPKVIGPKLFGDHKSDQTDPSRPSGTQADHAESTQPQVKVVGPQLFGSKPAHDTTNSDSQDKKATRETEQQQLPKLPPLPSAVTYQRTSGSAKAQPPAGSSLNISA